MGDSFFIYPGQNVPMIPYRADSITLQQGKNFRFYSWAGMEIPWTGTQPGDMPAILRLIKKGIV
jgi:hypothetical protein